MSCYTFSQELNVKCVTVSQDKEKYGVRFKADPDFRNLGERLKEALKAVEQGCKTLSDKELEVSMMIILVNKVTLSPISLSINRCNEPVLFFCLRTFMNCGTV